MKKKLLISLLILFVLGLVPAYCDNKDDATELYNKAIDSYNQEELNKSIELFNKAIELYPEFYEANYNLAQILMSLNKNDEALKPLETIYKIKPEDSENLYNLGKIYYKRGYLSKSHEYLKKIAATAPQYDSAQIIVKKIEKRKDELALEAKIKEHNSLVNSKGLLKKEELSEFSAPSGIAVDEKGNIYIASFQENSVYKISAYGQKTLITKSLLIKGPIGVAIDKSGNIYVANYLANNIVKISKENAVSVFAEIEKPYCMTYDSEHNRLYVTEQATNKLVKLDL